MEFLVCMLLATLFTGGRVAQDVIATLTGNTPPHVERARIRAEERARAAQQQKKQRDRSPYAQDKPQLKDVAAVYWGDALTDVIDSHNRRRAEKQQQQRENQTAAAEQRQPEKVRPPLKQRIKRLGRLLIDPVGENTGTATPVADPGPADDVVEGRPNSAGAVHDSPEYKMARNHCWECPKCGRAGLDYPTKEMAEQAYTDHLCAPARPVDVDARERLHREVRRAGGAATVARCGKCGAATVPTMDRLTGGFCPVCDATRVPAGHKDRRGVCELCGLPGYGVTVGGVRGDSAEFLHDENTSTICPRETAQLRELRERNPSLARTYDEIVAEFHHHTSTERQPMTTTDTTAMPATGEAVNYETAMAELDRLETAQQAHLDRAQATLEKAREMKAGIADTQASYRPSADAAGMVHQSLTALNVDQDTTAATGTMTDAMPPNEVDIMFDQLEAMEARIQQQVTNAETALAATHAARASLIEKYGDASTTVQQHLAGDSRFLAGTGAV